IAWVGLDLGGIFALKKVLNRKRTGWSMVPAALHVKNDRENYLVNTDKKCHSEVVISAEVNCEDLFDTTREFWVKGCWFKSWPYLFGCEQAKQSMKKIVASVGLVALGASGVQTAFAQDFSADNSKPWSISATLRGFYDDNVNTWPNNQPLPNGFSRGSW